MAPRSAFTPELLADYLARATRGPVRIACVSLRRAEQLRQALYRTQRNDPHGPTISVARERSVLTLTPIARADAGIIEARELHGGD